MKIIPFTLSSLLILAPTPLFAGNLDTDALLGGALGGAVGALFGSELGGRQGAILGSAIGGAAGTALTTRDRHPRVRREVIYVDRPVRPEVIYVPARHDNGLHRGHYKHKRKYYYDDYED
jgi:hypothetical protein